MQRRELWINGDKESGNNGEVMETAIVTMIVIVLYWWVLAATTVVCAEW